MFKIGNWNACWRLFDQAGLSGFIDRREGGLRHTLKSIDGSMAFVLVDIRVAMARPAPELAAPQLRGCACVVCDNMAQHRSGYADNLAFLEDPANGFRTMASPFGGELESSVRCRT